MKRILAALVLLAGTCAGPAAAQELTGRFLLETHDGQRVTDASFAGRVRLMAFGYTFCPDICPTTLSTLSSALDLLGPQAADVVPIFVTVDPKRDTREHLKEYVSAFGPAFIGLTGTPEMTDAAAKAFKVRYVLHPPMKDDPDTYLVDHSAGIFIMDRDGRFAAKLGHMATAGDVAERLAQVLHDQGKPR
jgi:protein SCO1/2